GRGVRRGWGIRAASFSTASDVDTERGERIQRERGGSAWYEWPSLSESSHQSLVFACLPPAPRLGSMAQSLSVKQPFHPFSLFPQSFVYDISFWAGPDRQEADFHALVREASRETVEDINTHPDIIHTSYCYRLTYYFTSSYQSIKCIL
uniref:Uncharacterized protein n=1 Tax=Oncorhynchus tshawytscha TaxID=74940 RepID=A0AAZ3RQR0_ONCTS